MSSLPNFGLPPFVLWLPSYVSPFDAGRRAEAYNRELIGRLGDDGGYETIWERSKRKVVELCLPVLLIFIYFTFLIWFACYFFFPETPFHFTLPKEGDIIPPLAGATPPLIGHLKLEPKRHSTPIGE